MESGSIGAVPATASRWSSFPSPTLTPPMANP